MRALCGSIITAGALIGLGLAALGMGTRYQGLTDYKEGGRPMWIKFHQMDVPLMVSMVVLVAAVIIGFGIAFMGLAMHHERRHRERLREQGGNGTAPHTHATTGPHTG